MTGSLSVVIPVHNAADLLPLQLDAVAAALVSSVDTEVIVVDNRSSDASATAARAWSAERGIAVRVVCANERAGEPHARNIGLRAADGDNIVYCDADDEVSATWIQGMTEGLSSSSYVTGPVEVVALNEPWQIAARPGLAKAEPETTFGEIPFAHGCNMGFRRQTLLDLGGFDESFLISCDVEIGVRAWRQGVQLAWSPLACVHYRLRTTTRQAYAQSRAYGRARRRIIALLPDVVDRSAERRATLRRVAWMARNTPGVISRPRRARLVWVAGQLTGELQGMVSEARR